MQAQIKFKLHRDYQLGLLLLKRNQHMEALDRFKLVLNQFPNHKADVFIPIYKHLMIHYKNHNIRILLAELYCSLGHYDDALDELEDIFEETPEFTQMYYILGKLFSKHIHQKRIIEIFESAFQQGIYDSSIIDILPKVYLENGNLEKSISLFSTLITIKSDSIPYHKTLAKLYQLNKNYDQSALLYRKLTTLSPDLCTEAALYCEKLLNHDPKNFDIRKDIVGYHIKSCKPELAVSQLKEMYKMDAAWLAYCIKTLKYALTLFPNHSDLSLFLAECFILNEEITEAVLFIDRLIELDPDTRHFCKTLIQDIRTKHPTHISALMLHIKQSVQTKSYKKALDLLEIMISLPDIEIQKTENFLTHIAAESIEKDRCYFLMAKLSYQRHKKETCLHYCDALIGSIYDKEARLFEVNLYKESDLKRSYSLLSQLLEDYPFDAVIHHQFSTLIQTFLTQELQQIIEKQDHTHSYFKIGLIHIRIGQLFHAIETFQKIPESDKNHLRAQLLIGRCFLELGKYDIAINHLSRTLEHLPKDEQALKSDVLFLLSISHHMNGTFKTGVSYLEQILEIDINHHLARQLLDYYRQQNLLQIRGKAATVYLDFHQNLTLLCTVNKEVNSKKDQSFQSFALPHNDQGVDYLLKENYPSASAEFKLAIQMDPSLTISYSNLALVYIQQNKFKKAHDMLDKALKINGSLDILYLHKGIVYYKEQDFENAFLMINKALSLSPQNEIFQFNLGAIHFKNNDLSTAFKWWQDSSKIGLLAHAVHRYVHYLFSESFSDSHWLSLEPFTYHSSSQK